jgi:hypothetical protein
MQKEMVVYSTSLQPLRRHEETSKAEQSNPSSRAEPVFDEIPRFLRTNMPAALDGANLRPGLGAHLVHTLGLSIQKCSDDEASMNLVMMSAVISCSEEGRSPC